MIVPPPGWPQLARDRATIGRLRANFGRFRLEPLLVGMMVESGPILAWPISGRVWPISGHAWLIPGVWSNLADLGLSLATPGQVRPTLGNMLVQLGPIRAILSRSGEFCRNWPSSAPIRRNPGKLWSVLRIGGRTQPNVGRISSQIGRA